MIRVKAVHALVSGRVQAVGYRQACRQVARSLGLVGWVRNRADGRVEILAQGDAEAVDRLITWSWAGPGMATVSGVESEVVSPDPNLSDFFIQPTELKSR